MKKKKSMPVSKKKDKVKVDESVRPGDSLLNFPTIGQILNTSTHVSTSAGFSINSSNKYFNVKGGVV